MGVDALESRRRTLVVRLLALGSVAAVGLVGARVIKTESGDALNLVWNLVLAWIPFLLAILVYDGFRRGVSRGLLLLGAALWLLFLPNAPYLVTDFKYLGDWVGVPDWYDILLLVVASGTGLALGFVSLYLLHAIARRILHPAGSWVFVVAVLGLTSLGVYIGRFERWNSWDVFAQPASLLSDVAGWLSDPLQHGRAVALMALFTACLTLAYGLFCRLLELGPAPERE